MPRGTPKKPDLYRANMKRLWADPAYSARQAVGQRRVVPAWVARAGLAEEFMEYAKAADEFAAAAHCRRLTAEMRS